ncbi:MAG TPA: primosomal protein N', partial [Planctomycetota bacterium]|nr:primosomal protein N' [Planctomycetota bacterium]
RPAAFLLHGVTGSGKTEVYLRAIESALAAGRSAIVLVPEIALTPQTVERFRARFRDVTVLHSRLTDAERAARWRQIREGRARVVVGARSAVFAPVADLGLIVVDEEHEPSFKQASAPRYHARDVAVVRGRLARAAVVLGSATPSLETWQRALDGKLGLLRLTKRVAGGELPPVRVADLRTERVKSVGAAVPLTRPLREAVDRALERKEKVILFLNRRGFAPALWCSTCESTARCARCAASLTLHRRIARMVCHLCHDETPVPRVCPNCGAATLRTIGAGTERIEQMALRAFPKAHVARMDADATLARGSHEAILDRFRRGEADVLVGTQMIAKGLDVPEVTVVGVLDADASLHIPEFLSAERTFQLVAQVAGRAGRSTARGQVIVQTSSPDHPAIARAVKHDFEGFARDELALRRRHRYPPFVRLIRVLIEAPSAAVAERAIEEAASMVRKEIGPGIDLLGPAPAPIETIRGKHRFHFLVRCSPPSRGDALRPRLLEIAVRHWRGDARAVVDVDPLSTL